MQHVADALDRRILLPVLAAYGCSYVDRSNLANSLTSLESSIGLTPERYALASALFTLALVLVEIPSNALLERHGPRRWLTLLVAGCGACTVLQGCVPGWRGLVGVRAVLGLFEGGVFPGALFALTLFYPPEQLTVRIACFTLAASLAFALGALLAGAVLPLGGEAWRALFVLQGVLTLAVSTLLYARLPAASSLAELGLTRQQTSPPSSSTAHPSPALDGPPSQPRSRSASPRRPFRAESSTPLLTPATEYPPRPAAPFFPPAQPEEAAAVAAGDKTAVVRTLRSPLTAVLALAYLLLLLATTPAAFLPRLLQSRWALAEPAANAVVGGAYLAGGGVQLALGWWAGGGGGGVSARGRARAVVLAVAAAWLAVALWERAMQGQGVRAVPRGWEWVGPASGRWVGVGLRVGATMATPALGSLFLGLAVGLPSPPVPDRAVLTACVISVGNLAQCIGPYLYASCLPLLTPSPSSSAASVALPATGAAPPDAAAAAAAAGFAPWRALAQRDLLMALAVLAGWAGAEGACWWAAAAAAAAARAGGGGSERASGRRGSAVRKGLLEGQDD